jgi:hypothetical protein
MKGKFKREGGKGDKIWKQARASGHKRKLPWRPCTVHLFLYQNHQSHWAACKEHQ